MPVSRGSVFVVHDCDRWARTEEDVYRTDTCVLFGQQENEAEREAETRKSFVTSDRQRKRRTARLTEELNGYGTQ